MSDMGELFSRDPLKLTSEDIDNIIAEYRKRRHLFDTGAGRPAAKKSALANELGIKVEL